MALSVTYSVKQNCKSEAMIFTDDTPDYDNVNTVVYLGGYSVQMSRAHVGATTFELETPSGIFYRKVVYTDTDEAVTEVFPSYLPTTITTAYSLFPKMFYTYKKRGEAKVITSKEGATIQIYVIEGSTGNVTVILKPGGVSGSEKISSTSDTDVIVLIEDGVSTVANIKTILLTHTSISAVKTTGTAYTLGENKIIASGGVDATTPTVLPEFKTGCYKLKYKVFNNTEIAAGSTSIIEGSEYIVIKGDANEYITYNGNTYITGETFVGSNGQNDFTANGSSQRVVVKETETENTIMYWCSIREKIKDLMILSNDDKCAKNCDFVEALSNVDTELTSIFVAMENDNLDCACDNIGTIELYINEFLKKCCC